MSIAEIRKKVHGELERVVFGQSEVIDFSLAALLSCGHVLLEGPPGTAKTLLVRTIAAMLNLEFRRVQMTPDLLPNDILGASIYREDLHTFEFRKGPVFANFLLADEINRASARTQAALLEAMQEQTVTHDSISHALPQPFIVFATQNPIEQEGTYPLPIAQLDRFMFKIHVNYPPPEDEDRVLREHHGTGATTSPAKLGVTQILDAAQIHEFQATIRQTHVREEVIGYVRRLVCATRDEDDLAVGASPRAGLMLLVAAKCLARFENRDFVTPEDIKSAFLPTMRHRVVLAPSTEIEGIGTDEVLRRLLEQVEVPR